jgi:hypothetical protein
MTLPRLVLALMVAGLLFFAAEVARAAVRPSPTVDRALRAASARYGVPYAELRAVAWCESRFNPSAVNATSVRVGRHLEHFVGADAVLAVDVRGDTVCEVFDLRRVSERDGGGVARPPRRRMVGVVVSAVRRLLFALYLRATKRARRRRIAALELALRPSIMSVKEMAGGMPPGNLIRYYDPRPIAVVYAGATSDPAETAALYGRGLGGPTVYAPAGALRGDDA